MESRPVYQPLHQDEDELFEENNSGHWNASKPKISRTKRGSIAYIFVMVLSLSTNVLLVLSNARLQNTCNRRDISFSGLDFDTLLSYQTVSKYWSPNASNNDTEAAWDNIDTNAVAVALHNDYIQSFNLPPSGPFPWDTERSVYYVKSIHDLHCLKLIRKAIASKHNNASRTFNLKHIYHCLDGLRQDIMCTADDTPMPAAVTHHVGEGQVRQCRDWDKLLAWARQPDRHACYEFDDYREATNTLELFAFCPPESPYKEVMHKYFEVHGHRDAYEMTGDAEAVVVF